MHLSNNSFFVLFTKERPGGAKETIPYKKGDRLGAGKKLRETLAFVPFPSPGHERLVCFDVIFRSSTLYLILRRRGTRLTVTLNVQSELISKESSKGYFLYGGTASERIDVNS